MINPNPSIHKKMKDVCAIVGASDPEMNAIEKLLKNSGVTIYQAKKDGQRVHPGNAYQSDPIAIDQAYTQCLVIETSVPDQSDPRFILIDHHNPGDPGFNMPPEKFWIGSSIGQMTEWLKKRVGSFLAGQYEQVQDQLYIVAAADHCLGPAYQSECPNVSPRVLSEYRAEVKSVYQKKPIGEIQKNIEISKQQIEKAPWVTINEHKFKDLRGLNVVEAPEAAAQIGVAVMYDMFMTHNKRTKIGLLNAEPDQVDAWIFWAKNELDGVYGSAARGYAGGLKKQPRPANNQEYPSANSP